MRIILIAACFALLGSSGSAMSHERSTPASHIVAMFNCKTGEKVIDHPTRAQYLRLAASGLCSLGQYTNGTYYCSSTSCSGTCHLHNIPVYCSCD